MIERPRIVWCGSLGRWLCYTLTNYAETADGPTPAEAYRCWATMRMVRLAQLLHAPRWLTA